MNMYISSHSYRVYLLLSSMSRKRGNGHDNKEEFSQHKYMTKLRIKNRINLHN